MAPRAKPRYRYGMTRRTLTRRTTLVTGSAVLAAGPALAGMPPQEAWTLTLPGFDGADIAYRSIGVGRPVLMLHGFLSSSTQNWIAPGIADRLARAGRRVILPDFRAHGRSAAPLEPAAYPKDALAMDVEAIVAALELTGFDIVGYSLGARIAVRLLARGMHPGRVALCGMGYAGVTNVAFRQALFEDAIVNGEAAQNPRFGRFLQGVIAQTRANPQALLLALRSQIDTDAQTLATLTTPILALSGAEDQDNGSHLELAAALPNARSETTPGDHLSAITFPEFSDALARFLAEG